MAKEYYLVGDVECYHAIFAEPPEPNEIEWAEAGILCGRDLFITMPYLKG